jgi:hypothetical protein
VKTHRPAIDRFDRPDCSAARQTLELARPGETDAAVLAGATRHAESCPACRAAVRRQERLDTKIGALCRDVPVPDGLRERLLASLEPANDERPTLEESIAATGSAETETETEAAAPTLMPVGATGPAVLVVATRQRLLKRVAAAVACTLVAGMGVWYAVRSARPTLDLSDLVAEAIADELMPEGLPDYTGPAALRVPDSMETRYLVDSPRQLATPQAAVYFFRMRTPGGRLVEGRLLVVPYRLLVNPPIAASFLAGSAYYPGHGYCASTWFEGELVYVCLAKGGEDDLRRLRRAPAVSI